jgi:hypothetical protein
VGALEILLVLGFCPNSPIKGLKGNWGHKGFFGHFWAYPRV